jgi:hypothetical protein
VAISETQLETWSHQGSVAQSKATYDAIKAVLNDVGSPYYQYEFDVFLQGSYGNDTNVWADSDVDVVIRLSSIYYYDDSELDEQEKQNFQKDSVPGVGYTFAKFKADVLKWLRINFGGAVREGKKAISIPGNATRRDADVVVCVDHRYYRSFRTASTAVYEESICFWTTENVKIINFPKQHSANCTAKHQATLSRFKGIVRVLKNMRNRMIEQGVIQAGIAPSYFLEGMLWNVPSSIFTSSYQNTFFNCVRWLDDCNKESLLCANGMHWLLRDGQQVCWTRSNFDAFRLGVGKFWNSH